VPASAGSGRVATPRPPASRAPSPAESDVPRVGRRVSFCGVLSGMVVLPAALDVGAFDERFWARQCSDWGGRLWPMAGPSGTVAFLFTDIEGSTRLWQQDEASMCKAVARHDLLLRAVVADHGGVVFSTMGDGVAAAFQTASAAVSCALEAQRLLG